MRHSAPGFAFLFLAIFSISAQQPQPDILIADFEQSTYGDWKTTGDAFGTGPAEGTLPNQMAVSGYHGKRLVNSYFNGDKTTGTLTSPPFEITRRYLTFLIGGGGWEKKTCVNLLVEGKVARTATGPNKQAGGSEALAPFAWDVSKLAGKTARIQIVDEATGGWGHINADHFSLSDKKPVGLLAKVKKEITITNRYLHFPVKQGAPKKKVRVLLGESELLGFDIELAESAHEWLAPLDVLPWKGKTLTVEVNRLPEDTQVFSSLKQADTFLQVENLYREPLRPRFHFSPKRGWTNDPNGLVYFNNEYHLFFQHNPYGWGWGNMHWGHAVSKDLTGWEELGEALYPDSLGTMFSGSAVVDWKNTSGFGKEGKPPLVLIYTAAGNPTTQCIAYSVDGRSFTKYPGNPVIKQITGGNRDPKVLWHESSKQWVMVLYVGVNQSRDGKSAPRHTIHFFNSPNLKDWTLASVLEGGYAQDHFLFECPDLFELPVLGRNGQTKWVLLAANSEYVTGGFDGKKFTPDTEKLQGHQGKNFYAPQTFSDEPKGRRIQFGWLQAPSPGMAFNQCMSVPMELTLVATPKGARLARNPVAELQSLRHKTARHEGVNLPPGKSLELTTGEEPWELELELQPAVGAKIVLALRGEEVVYDAATQEISCLGAKARLPMVNGKVSFSVFADRTSLELFSADGLVYIPSAVLFKPEVKGITMTTREGSAFINKATIHTLGSIWGKPGK